MQAGQPQAGQDMEVMEDVTIAVAEVPGEYFTSAQSRFSRDKKGAANDLRKAAAVLDMEAEKSAKDTRGELQAAARDVRDLARDVDTGAVKSVKDLNAGLARASHSLARVHHTHAEQAWKRKDTARAGHELKASGKYLEHAAAWTSKEAEKFAQAGVRTSRELSGDLIEGTGFVPEKVGEGLASVGRDIEKLGREVKPPRGVGGAGQEGMGDDTAAPQPDQHPSPND